jgi:psp operon transcriptional activator
VLLVGERGTGKELAATRLHYLSPRWQGPRVNLHCAALSPAIIESELFGHERGAFTGAHERRPGRFESADGGTLFLDEIGVIPREVQEKLLRVVEYGTFERVGGSRTVTVDVRIVAATNADLQRQARQGAFLQDLLDRLSFEVLYLPPLRRREGDIPLLAEHFARRMARELGRGEPPVFAPKAMSALEAHPWPGNIRELKNVVERSVYRTESGKIESVELDPFRDPYSGREAPHPLERREDENDARESVLPDWLSCPLREAVQSLEIHRLRRALSDARYHQKKAAASLGLSYDQFRGLYRKYGKQLRQEPPETATRP